MLTKEGAFVGPQTRQLIQDLKFEHQLSEVEKAALKSFINFIINFGGNFIRLTTIVIWWLILYSATKRWGLMCLQKCTS